MKRLLKYLTCLLVFASAGILTAQPNHLLDLRHAGAYLNMGADHSLKPTSQLSFGCWVHHPDWPAIANQPTLLGNTQHVGYALSLTEDMLTAWVAVDSVYEMVQYPTEMLSPGWHHMSCSFDGREIRLMVDGLAVAAHVLDTITWLNQPDTSISFMLGAETRYNHQPHPAHFFTGLVDDVFVMDRAIAVDELQRIIQQDLNLNDASLLLYINFEAGFMDLSPYHRPVKAVNDPEIRSGHRPEMKLYWKQGWLSWGFTILLLMLCIGSLKRLHTTRGKWFLAFLLINACSLIITQPYFLEWWTDGIVPGFWNPKIATCLYLLSLGFLIQSLAHQLSTHMATALVIVLTVVSVFPYVVPVAIMEWLVMAMAVLVCIYVFLSIMRGLSVLPLIGSAAMGLGVVAYLLELTDIWLLHAYTPVNSQLGMILMALGFMPLTGGSEMPVIREKFKDVLSDKEIEVTELITRGHTDAEIAMALKCSANTVKTHNKRIYSKLGISGRRELASLVTE